MSGQLEQLLGYLEREGVTQVVIGAGRPISMRTPNGFTNLTARPLSPEQLGGFLRHSEISPLLPAGDGDGPVREVQVGRRRAVAQIRRRGADIILSLTRADGATQPETAQRPATTASPHPKWSTAAPRAKSPTSAPRAKSPTAAPRAKSSTAAPRAKSSTAAPRAKSSTRSPRTKPPTAAPRSAPTASTNRRANLFDSLSLDEGLDTGGIALDPSDDTTSLQAQASPAAPAALARSADALELDVGPLDALELDPGPAMPPPRPNHAASAIDRGSPLELDPGPAMPPPRPNHAASAIDRGMSLELDDLDDAPTQLRGGAAASPAPPPRAVAMASKPSPLAPSQSGAPRELVRAESGAFGALVRAARARGASDLHVSAARVTSIRLLGELVPLDPSSPPLAASAVDDMLLPLVDDVLRAQLDRAGYVDFALEAPGGGRLRANISRQQQGLKGTFRLALAAPATLEQLGLPGELAKVVGHHQGLVVIAGPSGHGKTTTLASLVDLLNSSRAYHILTIEDPIEIVHPRKQAVVSQREAGRHTQSFARGLKASLREDPDVIVIGELRDRESVEIALTAAETGHLVIATMSTPSAAKTIDRLIDMFPPEEHSQVRASVAGALRAIVAQRLLPKRGGGVIPAIELVTGVLPLAVLIRDDKLFQLPSLMQRGRAFGMIRFDESLAEHVRAGRLDEETALAAAESKKDLAATLRPAPAAPVAQTSGWGFGRKEQR